MTTSAQKSTSLKKKIVSQYLDDTHENLIRSHPVVSQWLEAAQLSIDELRFQAADTPDYAPANKVVNSALTQQLNQDQDASLLHTITTEEENAILYKMREMVKLNPQDIEQKDLLYLEQQLSDIFGFEISSELEGHKLPFIIGTMSAQPHLRRYPADKIVEHGSHIEAGIDSNRSTFGWMLEGAELSKTAVEAEKFGVSIPLNLLPEWQQDRSETKKWFKYRKLLVVNPFELKAVVAATTGVGPTNTLKYQFSGSPEVIRSAFVWSQASQGKVLTLFINDPQNKVPLGPIDLSS